MPICILLHEFNTFTHETMMTITPQNPIDLYVLLDLVTKYPKEKLWSVKYLGFTQNLRSKSTRNKFYTYLLLDIKIRSLRYFINLAQNVSTVKSHLIFVDV